MKMNKECVIGIILIASFRGSPALGDTVAFHSRETVLLPCHTTHRIYVQWRRYHSHPRNFELLFENGQLDESYQKSLSLQYGYTLIINNATAQDAGYYLCIENNGVGPETITYRLLHEESSRTTPENAVRDVTQNAVTKCIMEPANHGQECWPWIVVTALILAAVIVAVFFFWHKYKRYRGLPQHDPEAEQAKQRIVDLEMTIRQTQQQNQTLEEKKQNLEQKIDDLQQIIRGKEQQNQNFEALQQKNRDLESRVQFLQGGKSNLKTELKCSTEKSERLEKEVKDNDKRINDMTSKQESLKDELANKKEELATVTTDLKHVSERKNEYESKCKDLEKQCQQYRSELQEKSNKLIEAEVLLKFYIDDQETLSQKVLHSGATGEPVSETEIS